MANAKGVNICVIVVEMVKDIIETRAELYRALHRSPRGESEEEEEEGKDMTVNIDDQTLTEHLKLKESFLAGNSISYLYIFNK